MELEKTVLTSREWQESKKCPQPFRNKKKYYRKKKHKSSKSEDFFCYTINKKDDNYLDKAKKRLIKPLGSSYKQGLVFFIRPFSLIYEGQQQN